MGDIIDAKILAGTFFDAPEEHKKKPGEYQDQKKSCKPFDNVPNRTQNKTNKEVVAQVDYTESDSELYRVIQHNEQ